VNPDLAFAERAFRFYASLATPRAPRGVTVMNPYTDPRIQSYLRTFLDKYFSDNRERTLILGINPGRFGSGITGVTFTDPVALGFDAWSVTASGDAVWVSDYIDDALVRVDPATRAVVARIPVPSGPTEIATQGDTVWVVCSAAGMVARIDATRNAVNATIRVGAWALAIAVAGDDVWVRGGSARDDGGLYRIDARTNAVVAVIQAGAPQGREGVASIAASDRGVWVPGVSLVFVDRATGAIGATLPVSSYAVALDGADLWVLNVFGRLERHAVAP